MNKEYAPIPCDSHSQLEVAILHRLTLDIRLAGEQRLRRWRGVDIFTRDGAEYLRLRSPAGEQCDVRLDRLLRVTDVASGNVLLNRDMIS